MGGGGRGKLQNKSPLVGHAQHDPPGGIFFIPIRDAVYASKAFAQIT